MVKKNAKKKDPPSTISVEDRLKLQLLNAVVDRADKALEGEKLRMENARLGMVITQRDLDTSKGDLKVFGDALAEKYQFDMATDSVDWLTGEIKRQPEEEDSDDA
jgi:hypothetical protein